MRYKISIITLFSILALSCKENTLFTKINAENSGITFSNRITENDSLNILDFEYVYNGSGVGVADFNNDGLQDLFFSGNQVKNKLYLNKGDFKFDDVSKYAQIEGENKWNAGVVTVDINADGLMDVYVACTVKDSAADRENLLYVNQGIKDGKPNFKEMAAEYGINDNGHSENASFFDYDNDGDLDLYVLTNIIDQNPNQYRIKHTDGSDPNTDRLYRCDFDSKLGHAVYKNVSKEAGILIEGFGLGLNICDINKDGWKDIYVTNDYLTDDLLYINNKNGTFTDKAAEFLKHTSNSAMGNDVADINNDGFLDLISMDMLAKTNERKKRLTGSNNYQVYKFNDEYAHTYQYMRNCLQLNNGITSNHSPKFSEISLMAGIAETDWSWTPSAADFDNDGYRDLIITNGFPKDITDRDFAAYRAEVERLLDKQSLLAEIPVVKISNFAFKNKGDLNFEDVTEKWGMNIPSFSNGAVYADLDNDGDLDYVVNNINDSAFVFKNQLETLEQKGAYLKIKFKGDNKNINGLGTVVNCVFDDGQRMTHENNPHRGYLSSVEPFMHIGLGTKKIKQLTITWYNGFSQVIDNPSLNISLEVNIRNAKTKLPLEFHKSLDIFKPNNTLIQLSHKHEETDYIDFNSQNLIPFKLSQLGPGISVADVNNDGLEDAYIAGSKGFLGNFLIQNEDGKFKTQKLIPNEIAPNRAQELSSLFFDAENDGDQDLYVCLGGNERSLPETNNIDEFFINDGKGNFRLSTGIIPNIKLSTSCARALDYDNDGDLDLIIAGRNIIAQYPKFTDTHIFRNDSKPNAPKFTDLNLSQFKSLGLVCDILCTDFDNDGFTDLIMASEWSAIKFFKNEKGKFRLLEDTGLENNLGLWTSINGADFDHDGDIDYIAGNIGQNTLLKGTENEPVTVYANDFDKNGVYDVIPFVYFRNTKGDKIQVPFNGKDDVNKQYNPTRARFVDYKTFANANIDNLLTDDEKKSAQKLDLNFNASVYIENLGKGKFMIKELPKLAQISTVNGILINDFDADGNMDVLLSGNNFGNEISSGRYDASNGLLLLGNGKGVFNPILNSGFYMPNDAKALAFISNPQNEIMVLATENRGEIKAFKTPLIKQSLDIKNKNRFTYEINKKSQTVELYYGSSYLSQSSRSVIIPQRAVNVKVF